MQVFGVPRKMFDTHRVGEQAGLGMGKNLTRRVKHALNNVV